jgi:molybdopterin/thiamine biosynthesis adenylyltransferase
LLQAVEALKCVLGIGTLLTDRMLIYDALREQWRTVQFLRDRQCPLCGEQPSIQRIAAVGANEDCG